MSTRDIALSLVNILSDEQIDAFLTEFADENTIARLETEALANDPNAKRYSSFKEFREEMEREENE